jgi:hypothetical protein
MEMFGSAESGLSLVNVIVKICTFKTVVLYFSETSQGTNIALSCLLKNILITSFSDKW